MYYFKNGHYRLLTVLVRFINLTVSLISGNLQSKAVIRTLLDLLYEEEADVRAVSCISLAHAASGIVNPRLRTQVIKG